jgi:TolA-binding protein
MRTLLLPLLLALLAVSPAAAQSPEEQLAAASALFDAKRYPEAAQRLEAFLAVNGAHPKAGAAAFALGRCYSESRQWAKAVPAYEKAVAAKDAGFQAQAQLGLGEAAIHARQYEKAVAALNAAAQTMLKPEQAAIVWFWLGHANLELKRYPAAEQAYARVMRDHHNSEIAPEAYFGGAVAALRQDKKEPARQRLMVLVDRYPNAADRPQALLMLAQLDLEAKRFTQARSGFEAVLDNPSAKAAELRAAAEDGLIQALLALQEFGAAATRLEAALTRLPAADPERFRAQLSLGHCRYRLKQYAPALAAYAEAAKSTEEAVAAEGHYWAANCHLAANRPADAAAEFGKLTARFPKHELAPKAQLKAADALAAARQADGAAAAYRLVAERFPQSPEAAEARKALSELVDAETDPVRLAAALKMAAPEDRARGTLRLARIYLQGKKYAEAQAPLNDLLKTNPAPEAAAEARYLLGLSYEAQDKAAPAAAAFSQAVAAQPQAAWAQDAHSRLAWLYLELKQPANAETAASAILAGMPEPDRERQARLALVQALLDQEKWDPALEQCAKLTEGTPPPETLATVLFTQAWIHEKKGQPEQAQPLWERLAAEHPKSNYAEEALMRLGDAQFKAEKYEEARARFQALVTQFPAGESAAEARFKLASSLYNLDKPAEAAAEWDRAAAMKNAGDYLPEALYWAGVAWEKAGKKPEAIQRLTRLVTQFPKHARVANAKIRLAALKAVN